MWSYDRDGRWWGWSFVRGSTVLVFSIIFLVTGASFTDRFSDFNFRPNQQIGNDGLKCVIECSKPLLEYLHRGKSQYSSTCIGRPPSWAATCIVRPRYQCPDRHISTLNYLWSAATCNERTRLPGPEGVRSWQVLLYLKYMLYLFGNSYPHQKGVKTHILSAPFLTAHYQYVNKSLTCHRWNFILCPIWWLCGYGNRFRKVLGSAKNVSTKLDNLKFRHVRILLTNWECASWALRLFANTTTKGATKTELLVTLFSYNCISHTASLSQHHTENYTHLNHHNDVTKYLHYRSKPVWP